MNNEESNTKTRRLQSITNNDMIQNNCRTRTSVDSFVQMNLKRETPSIDIKLEDYKKVKYISFVFLLLLLHFFHLYYLFNMKNRIR
jgi:hypothetical protein